MALLEPSMPAQETHPTTPLHGAVPPSLDSVREIVARVWGFPSLHAEQETAIRAALAGRDSLVVMPTGGGKSLCYQAPAVATGGTTVVVSPLIALMKDQVDGLHRVGVRALRLDSSLLPGELRAAEESLRREPVPLLFVSPERVVSPEFQPLLDILQPAAFAIDEAHCISHWGHDFRPEYRRLAELRRRFAAASFHAFTATATEQVRRDILDQLELEDPEVVIGRFDRPNLTYRVLPRLRPAEQIAQVLSGHRDEAAIVYCITRREVDRLAERLAAQGHRAGPYHAGMSSEERSAVQQAFAAERLDVVVATVAFGMGVDRSNIRLVLHTGMPKSIEHYQQETGRAGRDGLPAECVLLYSEADFLKWRELVERSAVEAAAEPKVARVALAHLEEMARYCRGAVCRHRALSEYFGQAYGSGECGACDLCFGERDTVEGALEIAQKVLSCVARVGQRFGVEHVIKVLRGADDRVVRERGHQELSTYGLLEDVPVADLRDWIYQLIGQGALERSDGEYPVLRLTPGSRPVLRGEREVRFVRIARRRRSEPEPRSRAAQDAWEGVDRDLFEHLRALRRDLAERQGVPPYVIFHDTALRDMARYRPTSATAMARIKGVGEYKLATYGPPFLEAIVARAASRDGT
ncbi:MAG: DNA helicase RecQ [Thermoanaerobaculia bacterium]